MTLPSQSMDHPHPVLVGTVTAEQRGHLPGKRAGLLFARGSVFPGGTFRRLHCIPPFCRQERRSERGPDLTWVTQESGNRGSARVCSAQRHISPTEFDLRIKICVYFACP